MNAILFCCLLQVASLSQPANFQAVARQADEARQAAHVVEAIGLYRQALDLRPDWDEGWFYLGTLLYSADRSKEAVEAFVSLLKLHPKNGAAWAFKGLSEAQLAHNEEALAALEKARTLGVGNNPQLVAGTRYSLGILLNKFSRFDEARRELGALVEPATEPEDLVVALGLSALLQPYLPSEVPAAIRDVVAAAGHAEYAAALKRLDDASKLYRGALVRFPRTENLHYAYGVFLEQQGKTEEAESAFRQEIEISPSHVPARLHLANEYSRRRDTAAALPFARDAAELAPQSYVAHQIYGRVLFLAEDTSSAIKELQQAVQLNPDDPTSHFHLARAYRAAGKTDQAERENSEFLRLDAIRKERDRVPSPSKNP